MRLANAANRLLFNRKNTFQASVRRPVAAKDPQQQGSLRRLSSPGIIS